MEGDRAKPAGVNWPVGSGLTGAWPTPKTGVFVQQDKGRGARE
jgi:hypothetical protein